MRKGKQMVRYLRRNLLISSIYYTIRVQNDLDTVVNKFEMFEKIGTCARRKPVYMYTSQKMHNI